MMKSKHLNTNNYNYKRLENKYLKILDNILTTNPKFSNLSANISIIDTKMTPDGHHLVIHYQCNTTNMHFIRMQITKFTPYIKKLLSKRTSTKKLPNIYFKYDNSYDKGVNVEKILSTE